MNDLVPMRVRLYRRAVDLDTRRKAGQADWPPWNELPEDVRRGLKGGEFFKVYSTDWIGYDKVENLGTGAEYGQAIALVPEDFAEAAHSRWPHLVDILDETEAAAFWESRVSIYEPEHEHDDTVINRIYKLHALEQAGLKAAPTASEKAERDAALNPGSQARGVRVNPRKTWNGMKAAHGWGGKIKPNITKRSRQDPPVGWTPGRGK